MNRNRNHQLDHVVELLRAREHSALPIGDSDVLWGPISLNWLLRAAKLPGKTLAVAIALLFLRGRSGFAQVSPRAKLISRFGLSRQTAYRALQHLEIAGLISADRRRGRAPRVMFRGLDDDNPCGDRETA